MFIVRSSAINTIVKIAVSTWTNRHFVLPMVVMVAVPMMDV
jgi:hypothetical protein